MDSTLSILFVQIFSSLEVSLFNVFWRTQLCGLIFNIIKIVTIFSMYFYNIFKKYISTEIIKIIDDFALLVYFLFHLG